VFDYYILKKDDPKFDLTKPPEDGCYVFGLYLDGARWNDDLGHLDESFPKILNYSVPHIWLKPMENS